MPNPKSTPTKVKHQTGKKAQTLIRSPDAQDNVLFFVGYQEGELVWAGYKIVSVGDGFVVLPNAKEWPNFRQVPYSVEQLREGVLHSDDLVMALSLEKAIEIRSELVRRKKARIDKQMNAVMIMQKALAERDQIGLRACAATQTR